MTLPVSGEITLQFALSEDQLRRVITAINDGFTKVAIAIAAINPKYRFEGGGFMRTYPQDRPADTVTFAKPVVVDSEGGAVDPQPELNYTFSSDKTNICSVADNGDGTITATYNTATKLEDGSYDRAEIKAESNEITLPDGTTLKDVKTEQIQLVPGSAAGFAGGGFQFPEAAPAPPAPTT